LTGNRAVARPRTSRAEALFIRFLRALYGSFRG
jgi:hypothetical protein